MKSYKIIERASSSVVSLTDARDHLRVIGNDEDKLIRDKIRAAISFVENASGHVLTPCTYRMNVDKFTDLIEIDRKPISEITSITYTDSSGNEQTLAAADYSIDKSSQPARLVAAPGKSFPLTNEMPGNVVINFTAGYASTEIPPALREAVLLVLAHLYDNRGDEGHRAISRTVNDLLHPEKQIAL